MNQIYQDEGESGVIKSILLISLQFVPIVNKTKEAADEDPNSHFRNVKLEEVMWWSRPSFQFDRFGLEKLPKRNVEFAEQTHFPRSFPLSRPDGERRRNKRPPPPPFARI